MDEFEVPVTGGENILDGILGGGGDDEGFSGQLSREVSLDVAGSGPAASAEEQVLADQDTDSHTGQSRVGGERVLCVRGGQHPPSITPLARALTH
jgi:hypothetical protein